MARKLLSVPLALALSFMTGAAMAQGVVKQELVWDMGGEPETLDPQLCVNSNGGNIIDNIFEGLMRDTHGKIVPAMAESYKISKDQLTYTFKLRDAKWSDGKPVTARDFEYAWKRAVDPKIGGGYYGFQLFYIKGATEFAKGTGKREDVAVKAVDDRTLVVTLTAPTPYFLSLTAFITACPVRQDIVEKDPEGWANKPETCVTNGPFKLGEIKMGDRVVLVKNPNYWNAAKVKLQKVDCLLLADATVALTAYENNEIHVVDEVPTQEIARLKKTDPNFTIEDRLGTGYYIFNVNKKPVDNPKVRRALSLAIDRKAIVENVLKAGQKPAVGFIPYGMKDTSGKEFRDVIGNYGGDPNRAMVPEAKKLLAEAGYPNGKGFPEIEILFRTSASYKGIAEAIQEMWRKNLNINVRLSNQESGVFSSSRRAGNYVVAQASWAADFVDPMTFLDLFTSYSGNNYTQWKSKEYDGLIEKTKLQKAGPARDKLMRDAEKVLIENSIIMPIFHMSDPNLIRSNTKGVEVTTLGHFYFGNAEMLPVKK